MKCVKRRAKRKKANLSGMGGSNPTELQIPFLPGKLAKPQYSRAFPAEIAPKCPWILGFCHVNNVKMS
jgi:hypothetical protein